MLIVQISDTRITAPGIRWKGRVVSAAPSIGMQRVLDLQLEHDEFTLVVPAFLLHHWTEDNNLIMFHLDVNSGDGPYSFIEQL
jgi:hypothetical protein